MHKITLFPKNESELRERIVREASGFSNIVAQAGHFLVHYDSDENRLVPIIYGQPLRPAIMEYAKTYGWFPILTWEFGVSVLGLINAAEKRVMVVVNDWQYLPEFSVDRQMFYRDSPEIPQQYCEILKQNPSVQLLVPPRKMNFFTGDYWSEQTLRNGYERRFREMARNGNLPHNIKFDSSKELRCDLVDAHGNTREVYCAGKRSGCEEEVAEMLTEISDIASPDIFINYIPQVCKDFVGAGTQLAFDLFGISMRKVINVGLPSVGIFSASEIFSKSEVSIHEPRK